MSSKIGKNNVIKFRDSPSWKEKTKPEEKMTHQGFFGFVVRSFGPTPTPLQKNTSYSFNTDMAVCI